MSTSISTSTQQNGTISEPKQSEESSQASSNGGGMSEKEKAIVKSTAPVLAEHGVAITSLFYKRLLDNHPELRNIFNSAHQQTGGQPAALAHAVWAYAANIDNLAALTTAVTRISNKHASLGVTPDQYPIVGQELLSTIKDVLGEAATPEILSAWTAAYNQLADIFISTEQTLYDQASHTPGGWTGWRKFRIARKVHEGDEIVSFYLEPVDKGKLPHYQPGQYISVHVWVPQLGVYQPRQYSLSEAESSDHFRISVKKEAAKGLSPAGVMSNLLHENTPEGTEIDVSNPYGDFTLDLEASGPVVLISGGVGITPMLSMLGTLVEHAPQRQVVFVHAARSGKVRAMKDYLNHIMEGSPQVSKVIFYGAAGEGEVEGMDYDYIGRLDLQTIREKILLPDANYYICGPVAFMAVQQKSLEDLGVSPERIHSEVFGSSAA